MGPLTTTPAGYILCDGQAVSRTDYSELFAVLGTNFGSGDGSTTFNVPDYRGCFLRGLGGASGTLYAKQAQGLPNITGRLCSKDANGTWGITSATGRSSFNTEGGAFQSESTGWTQSVQTGKTTAGDVITFNASRSNPIYGSANENRPDNYAVQYFIKY